MPLYILWVVATSINNAKSFADLAIGSTHSGTAFPKFFKALEKTAWLYNVGQVL